MWQQQCHQFLDGWKWVNAFSLIRLSRFNANSFFSLSIGNDVGISKRYTKTRWNEIYPYPDYFRGIPPSYSQQRQNKRPRKSNGSDLLL